MVEQVYRWKSWGNVKIFCRCSTERVLFSRLMLGEFVDDYTVRVIDVFAMPQSGTGVSVEAVDPVFQAKMLDMLKQTGRPEMVVGWYHSHPGFGCWLSGVDINTQQSFEALTERAVVRDRFLASEQQTCPLRFLGRGRRSRAECQGQSRDRCVSSDQSESLRSRTRSASDHVESRSLDETVHPSVDPRSQSSLLFHLYKLPQERTRTKDALESSQEVVDGRVDHPGLQSAQRSERQRGQADARPVEELHQVVGGRGEHDHGAAGDSKRRQTRSQAALGRERRRPDDHEHRSMSRGDDVTGGVQIGLLSSVVFYFLFT